MEDSRAGKSAHRRPLMDDPTRRKVIKGTLAAPLVLTVGKAGATPRTTFSACLTESENRPEPFHAVVEEDEAFRVTRDVFEMHHRDGREGDKPDKPDESGGREKGKPKKSQEPVGWAHGNPNKTDDLYVLGWDNETMYRIEDARLVPHHTGFGGSFDVEFRPTGKKVDILAYLDDTGEVVGIAPQRNGGQWTTKRCYASIVGIHEDDTTQRHRWWG